MNTLLTRDFLESQNAPHIAALEDEYGSLDRQLERRGIRVDQLRQKVSAFSVALPSWGVGRGGTRFARFPIAGEPINIFEKLEDCAIVHQLSTMTPRVSLHFPWDKAEDYRAVREQAGILGLSFDAVNSNTFQDQPGQHHSYATGSLSSTVAATRQQAIEHNRDWPEARLQCADGMDR
jgi:L-rhamnose isomerase/sugar isomerase